MKGRRKAGGLSLNTAFAALVGLALGVWIFTSASRPAAAPRAAPADAVDAAVAEVRRLRALVHVQNETLQLLQSRLAREAQRPAAEHAAERAAAPALAAASAACPRCPAQAAAEVDPPCAAPQTTDGRAPPMPKAHKECERKFGLGLVESYRASAAAWCAAGTDGSSLTCYEHVYAHNGKVGHFCVAQNFVVDFSKVSGAASATKPAHGNAMYHNFGAGATSAGCKQTDKWQTNKLMPHAALQLKGMAFGAAGGFDETEAAPTYLLARDEDCENMFHSTADHLNAHLVGEVLRLDWNQVQTVLFDRHPAGPFEKLIHKTFSPARPLKRAADYGGKRVRFDQLVFHLESPAGIVFPKVAGPKGIMTCKSSSLWRGFRHRVLAAFDLLDAPPPRVPHVVLSVRRRSYAKNVGRVFADEAALARVLAEGDAMTHQVVDLGTLDFGSQLELLRRTNVLVGAHGAGLMQSAAHVMFLAEEAVLVEIHPSYRLDRHFRLAARMADKIYLPMRSTAPVQCRGSSKAASDDGRQPRHLDPVTTGSRHSVGRVRFSGVCPFWRSDAIPVDVNEFRAVLDGALRLARSFDDGVSECGLKCDNRILALDASNGSFLPAGAKALSTKFPCA